MNAYSTFGGHDAYKEQELFLSLKHMFLLVYVVLDESESRDVGLGPENPHPGEFIVRGSSKIADAGNNGHVRTYRSY